MARSGVGNSGCMAFLLLHTAQYSGCYRARNHSRRAPGSCCQTRSCTCDRRQATSRRRTHRLCAHSGSSAGSRPSRSTPCQTNTDQMCCQVTTSAVLVCSRAGACTLCSLRSAFLGTPRNTQPSVGRRFCTPSGTFAPFFAAPPGQGILHEDKRGEVTCTAPDGCVVRARQEQPLIRADREAEDRRRVGRQTPQEPTVADAPHPDQLVVGSRGACKSMLVLLSHAVLATAAICTQ